MTTSRQKGANGENEAIAYLQGVVDKVYADVNKDRINRWGELTTVLFPPQLERNQVRPMVGGGGWAGKTQMFVPRGFDIKGIPWAAIEIKRQENVSGLSGWWKQCREAAAPGQVPILMWRVNRGKWNVRFRLPNVPVGKRRMEMTVDVSWETFAVWFEMRLRSDLGE
jgi:hypothetical protein